MKRQTALWGIIVGMCAVACQPDTLYHTYRTTGERGWTKEDTLEFRIPKELTGRQHRMEMGIKHTESYPYQDLWIGIRRPGSPGLPVDTLHIFLADSAGRWTGTGMSGSSFQCTSAPVPFTLTDGDTLLQVIHLMAHRRLPGITDVGLRLSSFPGSVNPQKDEQQDGESPQ